MKPYKRQSSIQFLNAQARLIILLILAILNLASCRKLKPWQGSGNQPSPSSLTTETSHATPLGNLDVSGKQLPITDEMLDQVKVSSLKDDKKEALMAVLKSFRVDPQSAKSDQKVNKVQYELAFDHALELSNATILQALLQRRGQVDGAIDFQKLLGAAIQSPSTVGLQTLLKTAMKDVAGLLDKDLLKKAIRDKAQLASIKILLDPQVNPQASELVHAEVLRISLKQAIGYADPDVASKDILLTLLDPKLNPKKKHLIDQKMLISAIERKAVDLLPRLLDPQVNTHANHLSDKEIRELIATPICHADSEEILEVLLQDLVHKKGRLYIKDLIDQDEAMKKQIKLFPSREQVFVGLGLLDR